MDGGISHFTFREGLSQKYRELPWCLPSQGTLLPSRPSKVGIGWVRVLSLKWPLLTAGGVLCPKYESNRTHIPYF